MSDAPTSRPSPSGARLAGDRYQHLYTWLYGAKMLLNDPSVVRIQFEVGAAGNVDDLVVLHRSGPPLYHQIKFVTNQQEPLDSAWFTKAPKKGALSPLRRFWESFHKLTDASRRPEMVLLTNRLPIDDVLRRCTDGRSTKLTPRLGEGGPRSANGRVRQAWAKHLETTEAELLTFLDSLALKVGRESLDELYEHVSMAMLAAGLRGDREAMTVGMDIIKNCIETGVREMTAEALRPYVAEHKLAVGRAAATLLIQAIDHDPWPEAATARVDWVDLFEGDEPRTRRQLRDPSAWDTRLRSDVRGAVGTIRQHGLSDVDVKGAMRLSTGLFVGSELSQVAGFHISRLDRGVKWASGLTPDGGEVLRREIEIGAGPDLAVAVAVSNEIADDVADYIRSATLPVGKLIVYEPVGGTGQTVVEGPEQGVGYADQITAQLRKDTKSGVPHVHFFISSPLPLALLIGHRWNRIAPTQLYDDLGPGRGYVPTFTIDA